MTIDFFPLPFETSISLAATKVRSVKPTGVDPSELEDQVAQALFDLEVNSNDLKAELKDLTFVAAKEIEVSKGSGKKSIVIFVPFRQLKSYHKIQVRLIRELEKKFSGKHIVVIAQRRILKKPAKKNALRFQKRPRSRTATAVHAAIMEDLVYPTEITGKRERFRLDGSRLLKIHLDKKDQQNAEYKLETFGSVFKKLTGKDAIFEFPVGIHEP